MNEKESPAKTVTNELNEKNKNLGITFRAYASIQGGWRIEAITMGGRMVFLIKKSEDKNGNPIQRVLVSQPAWVEIEDAGTNLLADDILEYIRKVG